MPLTRACLLLGCVAAVSSSCQSPAEHVAEADEQVYGILASAADAVTGHEKVFPIGRPDDTLRARLLAETAAAEPVRLSIPMALDVAAENSREFAQQKESLYRTALNLTRQRHEFEVRWGAGGAADVSGIGDEDATARIASDLGASVRSTSGARIVAGFANTLLRSIVSGGGWSESSLLSLQFTQPLLQGFGEVIAREPLTQAERDVVYAVRSFERFRAEFAVDVVSSYLAVLQQVQNLDSVRRNYASVRKNRELSEALYDAGRRSVIDVGRARQSELSALNSIVNAENRLEAALDSFKLLLGLPVDAQIVLDMAAFDRLDDLGILPIDIGEERAIVLALARRYDYRTALDQIEDAGRQILVAKDALSSILDFSAALDVPSEPGKALKFDWEEIGWAAGFDLDLALDRLAERNSYRSALINFDAALRDREATEDRIKQQIRNALRDIEARVANYDIQTQAVELAEQRVESTEALYAAARPGVDALEVLDAQDALLEARLGLTGAIVDYAIARLELLRDLEAVAMEPKGLRLDLALPLPTAPQDTLDALRATSEP